VNRVFLISPANCNGQRARWIFKKTARSDLAKRLRSPEGAPLGEVYTFFERSLFPWQARLPARIRATAGFRPRRVYYHADCGPVVA